MPDFEIDKSRVLAFFDEASNNGVYGGGIALYSLDFHFVLLKLGHGKGTNQRVELINLWGLLKYVVQADILQLQFFGDSWVIIDWIDEKSKLHIAQLLHWCMKTKSLLLSLHNYTIQHIFKENNLTADGLSKEALQLAEGYLSVEEFFDHICIRRHTIQLYYNSHNCSYFVVCNQFFVIFTQWQVHMFELFWLIWYFGHQETKEEEGDKEQNLRRE